MSANTNSLFPRGQTLRAILATLCAAVALGFAIRSETPRGSVHGAVALADRDIHLDGVEIVLDPAESGPEYKRRYVKTGKDGSFSFANVTAGDYYLTASSRAHRAEYEKVTVTEGRSTDLAVLMTRSQEAFALRQNQKVYGTTEEARIAVSGYVDAKKPVGADTVKVRVYNTRLSNVLQHPTTAEALEKVGRSWAAAKQLPTELIATPASPSANCPPVSIS
jgi:hypothetical protein